MADYMESIQRFPKIKNILLITEDEEVIKDAESNFPHYQWHYTEYPRENKHDIGVAMSRGEIDSTGEALNALVNLFLSSECEYFVGRVNSTWFRLMIMLHLRLVRQCLVYALRRLSCLFVPPCRFLFPQSLIFSPATSKATTAWFRRRPLLALPPGMAPSGDVRGLLLLLIGLTLLCAVKPRPSTLWARLRVQFGTVRGEPESPLNLTLSVPPLQPSLRATFLFPML